MSDPVGRWRMRVTGVVQGVGFRPFVHALAAELGLSGFVGNDADGVFLEAQGPAPALAELERRIREEAPPLAVVEEVRVEVLDPDRGRTAIDGGVARRPGQPRRAQRAAASGSWPAARPGRHLDPAGHRRLRRLPGRDARPRRPPPRLPVHRLHPLRPAVHDHHRPALRPREHHHGRLPAVPGRAWPSTPTRPAGGSTPSRPRAPTCGPALSMPVAEVVAGAAGGADRGDQGHRRVPPGLRCPRRGGRADAARPQAARRQALRAHGRRPRRRHVGWPSSTTTSEALLTSPARPIVILPALDARPRRRRGARHRDPRRDAALRPPAPPAVRRRCPRRCW